MPGVAEYAYCVNNNVSMPGSEVTGQYAGLLQPSLQSVPWNTHGCGGLTRWCVNDQCSMYRDDNDCFGPIPQCVVALVFLRLPQPAAATIPTNPTVIKTTARSAETMVTAMKGC